MKKKFIVLFILLTLPLVIYAQQDDTVMITKMLQQADDMGKKFIAKDYKSFLKYSHPAVIKSMGGENKVYDQTVKDIMGLENEKVTFVGIKFGVPSKIIAVGNERQAVIPQIIEMYIPGGKLTNTASMLAISLDKGENWYFVDTGGHNLLNMKNLLPSLSDELIIPEPQDASFEEIKAE